MNEYNYDYTDMATNMMTGSYQNMFPDYLNSMPNVNNSINNYANNMPNMNNIPANNMANMNNVPANNPNSSKDYMKDNDNNKILDPYSGFVRGNMFDNLYDKYKNYKPCDINPSNEREALLEQWQQYNFALIDLGLYLDVYPNDTNALNLYKKYLDISNKTLKKYESMYGPLCTDSEYAASNKWNWDNSPWPWEGK